MQQGTSQSQHVSPDVSQSQKDDVWYGYDLCLEGAQQVNEE
jgi:hypothetical protein